MLKRKENPVEWRDYCKARTICRQYDLGEFELVKDELPTKKHRDLISTIVETNTLIHFSWINNSGKDGIEISGFTLDINPYLDPGKHEITTQCLQELRDIELPGWNLQIVKRGSGGMISICLLLEQERNRAISGAVASLSAYSSVASRLGL